MEKLYQEILLAMQEREQEISKLQEQNKEFLGYIECLEKKESFQNTGMDISQVKKKLRSLKTFLSHPQMALWLTKSFGLRIQGIQVKEQKTGHTHYLEVENSAHNGFDSLSDGDKVCSRQNLCGRLILTQADNGCQWSSQVLTG